MGCRRGFLAPSGHRKMECPRRAPDISVTFQNKFSGTSLMVPDKIKESLQSIKTFRYQREYKGWIKQILISRITIWVGLRSFAGEFARLKRVGTNSKYTSGLTLQAYSNMP